MAKTYNFMPLIILAAIAFGGWYLFTQTTVFKQQALAPGEAPPSQFPPGFAAALSVSGRNPILGTLTNVNAELWTSADGQVVGETQANAALTSLGTNFGNSFNGYVMIGNDNEQSTADRGTEYYYTKKTVSWVNEGGLKTVERIPTPAEGTPTFTCYDDGTVESTCNITVGSGSRVTVLSLKIETAADTYMGNPDPALSAFSRERLAIAINESTAGMFKEIAPTAFARKISVVGNISASNIVGSTMYVLPITWLDDDPSTPEALNYKTDMVIESESGQNPGVTAVSYLSVWDLTWCRNDLNLWVPCWGDESDTTNDKDAGMDGRNNAMTIWYN